MLEYILLRHDVFRLCGLCISSVHRVRQDLGIPVIRLSTSGPFGVWGQRTMLVMSAGRDI